KQEGSSNKKTLTISLVTVLIIVVLLTCGVYYSWRRNNRLNQGGLMSRNIPTTFRRDHVQRDDSSLNGDLPIIPLIVIQQSTNYFSLSSKLGEGGFGSVYKGTLPDGTEIAAKRLSETSGQGLEEFKNEVIFIA
ncbi:cysteine-rich receptor-like protein kinase, partial [Trifolium medium]|nr:cysteine-rich receptor-like protein kinase [Trifolium medium]